MATSRRKRVVDVGVPKIASELTSCYCRKCQKNRSARDFYDATDSLLDTNGKMSICRFCVKNIYEDFYVKKNDIYDAIYQTCRVLNVKYESESVEAVEKHLQSAEEKGKIIDQVFGTYLSKIKIADFGRKDVSAEDFTFHESIKYDAERLDATKYEDGVVDELERFWGTGMNPEQYQFLESEMDRYKRTHKCDTAAEESLLRQICFTELEIRESRQGGNKGSSSAVETLQKLMKTASVDPAKTAIAGAGKSQDTFSSFIKTIEQNEPADYYKDKGLFKDYDKIGPQYFEKYVTRPLKNFITQSRDFNIDESDDDLDDDIDPFDILEAGDA
jgi:hypothetical protein